MSRVRIHGGKDGVRSTYRQAYWMLDLISILCCGVWEQADDALASCGEFIEWDGWELIKEVCHGGSVYWSYKRRHGSFLLSSYPMP